ncbi:MAG: hypothetical protein R2711_19175 [Acidimicrobiales bacterium]
MVVKEGGGAPTKEELLSSSTAAWPSGGSPTTWVFIDEVPKTSVGQVLRRTCAPASGLQLPSGLTGRYATPT